MDDEEFAEEEAGTAVVHEVEVSIEAGVADEPAEPAAAGLVPADVIVAAAAAVAVAALMNDPPVFMLDRARDESGTDGGPGVAELPVVALDAEGVKTDALVARLVFKDAVLRPDAELAGAVGPAIAVGFAPEVGDPTGAAGECVGLAGATGTVDRMVMGEAGTACNAGSVTVVSVKGANAVGVVSVIAPAAGGSATASDEDLCDLSLDELPLVVSTAGDAPGIVGSMICSSMKRFGPQTEFFPQNATFMRRKGWENKYPF